MIAIDVTLSGRVCLFLRDEAFPEPDRFKAYRERIAGLPSHELNAAAQFYPEQPWSLDEEIWAQIAALDDDMMGRGVGGTHFKGRLHMSVEVAEAVADRLKAHAEECARRRAARERSVDQPSSYRIAEMKIRAKLAAYKENTTHERE